MNITITGIKHYYGAGLFKVGSVYTLEKDQDNEYDEEAIMVRNRDGVKVGYVANSPYTVAKGTLSAGRIYDRINENTTISVMFVVEGSVIARVE